MRTTYWTTRTPGLVYWCRQVKMLLATYLLRLVIELTPADTVEFNILCETVAKLTKSGPDSETFAQFKERTSRS